MYLFHVYFVHLSIFSPGDEEEGIRSVDVDSSDGDNKSDCSYELSKRKKHTQGGMKIKLKLSSSKKK